MTLHYNDYSSEYLGGQLDQNRWSLAGFFQLSALLPYGWKGEVSGWYQGKGFEGIIRTDALYGVSAGLERDFFDDRLNLVPIRRRHHPKVFLRHHPVPAARPRPA